MADDDKSDEIDKPEGPSPDEQARVDAEQLEIIERIRAARGPAEAEEARLRNERIERELSLQSERRSFDARLKAVEARLTALEASR